MIVSDLTKHPTTIDSRLAETVAIGHSTLRILLPSSRTAGTVAAIDYDVAPGFPGPALHTHPAYDEIFYVLEGTLSLRIADETVVAGRGQGAFVPGTLPHTFANPRAEPARALIVLTPGGFEGYFAELAELVREGAPDPEALAELWSRYGLEQVTA